MCVMQRGGGRSCLLLERWSQWLVGAVVKRPCFLAGIPTHLGSHLGSHTHPSRHPTHPSPTRTSTCTGRTIDWSMCEEQPGDNPPTPFSFLHLQQPGWRPAVQQVSCYQTRTTAASEALIMECTASGG